MSETPDKHRALIALDAMGIPRVLATDSDLIKHHCDVIDTDAENIGLVNHRETMRCGPGVMLWTGTAKMSASPPDYFEEECEYTGDLRTVTNPVELAELFAMSPPEPEYPEDDRESPGT